MSTPARSPRPRISRGSSAGYKHRSRKSWAVLAYLILSRALRPGASSPRCCSPRRTTRCGRCGGAWPRSGARWATTVRRRRPGRRCASRRRAGRRRRLRRYEATRPSACPGLGGPARRHARSRRRGLRVVAAGRAAALGGRDRGDLARGRAGADGTRRARRGRGYAVRAAAHEPPRREPSGPADPALPAGRRRRRRAASSTPRSQACCGGAGRGPGRRCQAATRQSRPRPGGGRRGDHRARSSRPGRRRSSAGAIEAGVQSLRTAARLADGAGATLLRVSSRLVLAEALIHSLGGLDEEGLATCTRPTGSRWPTACSRVAQARAELGYVDFLRARYDRAELWLTDALELASGSPSMQAKVTTYLGSVESDRGSYRQAVASSQQAAELSRVAGTRGGRPTRCPCAAAIDLFRGGPDAAAGQLDALDHPGRADHWLSFLPWPQALRGEVHLARADRPERPNSSAGLRPGLPARRSVLGGDSRPRPRPGRRGGGATPSVPSRSWPRPGPAAAGWPTPTSGSTAHPRRPVRPRPAVRPSGYRTLGRDAAQPGVAVGDERTHAPLAAARCSARPGGRQHRRGRAGG